MSKMIPIDEAIQICRASVSKAWALSGLGFKLGHELRDPAARERANDIGHHYLDEAHRIHKRKQALMAYKTCLRLRARALATGN